jgi:hypothetical protein
MFDVFKTGFQFACPSHAWIIADWSGDGETILGAWKRLSGRFGGPLRGIIPGGTSRR